MTLYKKIINKSILIKDVAKARDKLIQSINQELDFFTDEQREYLIEEIQECFDFDGEENE
jgi:hypothetical protein